VSAGQSNGVGGFLENNPANYGTGIAGVFSLSNDNSGVQQARDPINAPSAVLYTPINSGFPSSYVSNGRSFLLNFTNMYAASYLRPGRRVLLVQTCVSAVGFIGNVGGVTGWWSSTSPTSGGQAYNNMIARLTAAMGETNGGAFSAANNRVVAFTWQEGESDSQQQQTSSGYKAQLANLAAHVRAAITSLSPAGAAAANSMAFLVGAMVQDMMTDPTLIADYGNTVAVTAGAQDVAGTTWGTAVPYSAYVTSANIPPMNVQNPHYSDVGYTLLAQNYAAAYATLP